LLATRCALLQGLNNNSPVIRLTLIGTQAEASLAQESAYFRITGGVVWTRPEYGPLATYTEECWKHREVLWSGMRFEGQCRLVFGLPRDPVGSSEQLPSLSIHRRVLSANGVPFADYEPAQDMWHGAGAEIWWHAFRVESIELRRPTATGPNLHRDVIELPRAPEGAAHERSLN
jgi:hypothetical protein